MICNITEKNIEINSRLVFGTCSKKNPFISIVIPTFKRVNLLRKTIESVKRQKNLYKYSVEVVVVSNDYQFELSELGIELDPTIFRVYVNEENLGMCGNMNRCALMSKGDYITYVQDDDVLLPDYLESVIKLLESGKTQNIDCLIPNRYYLMPNDDNSHFGKKASRNIRIENILCKILRFGKKNPELMKITPYETMVTTYPFYSGGPTCGVMFKRISLLETSGFNERYPYGFDYDFFMYFSENYNVVLYDKYLSIYMTANSASIRSEVQYDFFKVRYDYLNSNYKKYGISDNYKNIIMYSTYAGFCENVRRLIDEKYVVPYVNKWKRRQYMIWACIKTCLSGGYRRKTCTKKMLDWYNDL